MKKPMKIVVLGNCQSVGIAQCIQAMSRDVSISAKIVGEVNPTDQDLHELVDRCDIAIVHTNLRNDYIKVFPNRSKNVICIPPIAFSAFHPDTVYVIAKFGPVQSPVGDYHSSLILYGWKSGLSIDDTVGLFNREVFERVGFFKFWEENWNASVREGEAAEMPLEGMLGKWVRAGCFMHTINHPKLFVLSDIARATAERIGLSISIRHPERFIADSLAVGTVWPVYPDIGNVLGIQGDYSFKVHDKLRPPNRLVEALNLQEFVERSYECYSNYSADDLPCPRIDTENYRGLKEFRHNVRNRNKSIKAEHPHPAFDNPYKGLASHQFWRKAIQSVPAGEVDPVVRPAFKIDKLMRIATAGSCFAQHIARTLQEFNYNYYVTEPGPEGASDVELIRQGYGVFSARYGNIYTVRQLVQLFDRAYGEFEPADIAWGGAPGYYIDPFRPQVVPDGYATLDDLLASRAEHFAAVRKMFETMDVFLFTLGLTEGWRSKEDGAVFPLAPGVAGGRMNFAHYEFVNFRVDEVVADLEAFLNRLKKVNARAKVILTVSPVPLIATYEDKHVIVSSTYSKSVLRVAAETVVSSRSNVFYFPSYEIVIGSFSRGAYYDNDARSVTPSGVEHVMRLFRKHYLGMERGGSEEQSILASEISRFGQIICDEEAVAASVE